MGKTKLRSRATMSPTTVDLEELLAFLQAMRPKGAGSAASVVLQAAIAADTDQGLGDLQQCMIVKGFSAAAWDSAESMILRSASTLLANENGGRPTVVDTVAALARSLAQGRAVHRHAAMQAYIARAAATGEHPPSQPFRRRIKHV